MEDVIIGTGVVLQIQIDPIGGLHMEELEFECDFFVVDKHILIKKELMTRETADSYIACLNTNKLTAGDLKMRIHAYIPDERFEGNTRDELVDVLTNIHLRK